MLHINFFELKGVKPDPDLYQYSLAFSNDKLSKPQKKRLIESLLSTLPFSAANIATDWNQKLVPFVKLKFDEEYTVVHYPEGDDPFPSPTNDDTGLANARRRDTYQITGEEVGTV
ncbi:uncharacterized protein J4E92_008876 [Alternaria infectoria]|uniref:uncharacterized protein n=1 Tax=Alternaria infectoria TaxID=45303 RepID=UPI00221E9586|nr:uncharacterized protein J4E92_008876 [Alternaria infectoria]KAI4917938.1 hypothetical protein J4E92_008876 [Alternaria infectoria]